MSEFAKRYENLNDNQKRAVNIIDGPVLVVAGPGTGKTELLGVRVANILQKTDTLPGNILCLTFTDNAAANMRDRLSQFLGPDAYKVAVHTFHSFGSEIINQNGEYFYKGAHFRPADELSSYEILNDILKKLPYDNPVASTMNGQFTYLRDIQTSIAELKRGGLTPDELTAVLDRNTVFINWVKPKLQAVFGEKISKKTIDAAQLLAEEILSYQDEALELSNYHALSEIVAASLDKAVNDAVNENSTKPLTAWKNSYIEKDVHNQPTLKDEKRGQKLQALSQIYFDYLASMQEHDLFDFDDMILRVVHALEVFDNLRFNLQERYQYIIVDEFQDTNDAQMRLIWNLTNNPAQEGRPNLMVVGDDDQAIYRFQGAEISNMLDFTKRYRDVQIVTLTDNYRSVQPVLELSRSVIVQAEERLESSLENISKLLTPHHEHNQPLVEATTHETTAESYAALAKSVAEQVTKHPNETHAVIARHHRELIALLPHFSATNINVNYEKQDNALDSEPVKLLEETARVIRHIARQEFDEANARLSGVLAHPAWGIAPRDIWELSLKAHHERRYWLEVMLEANDQLKNIAEWLIVGSAKSQTEPLEYMLDYIFGIGEKDDEFTSPYKKYFFGDTPSISSSYLAQLASLQQIRSAVRSYRPDTVLKLNDFIEYLDLHRNLKINLSVTTNQESDENAVTFLTAHKAKGLEFDTVYLLDAQENVWGGRARGRGRLLSFPSNLPLSPAGDSNDERLRLLYVAMTRARHQLSLVAARTNESGENLDTIGALSGNIEFDEEPSFAIKESIEALERDWPTRIVDVDSTNRKNLLTPLLKLYRLSATHLNNYLDVTKGGPEYFLLHNLLRLPEAMSPSAVYGSAIHAALQRAHQHLAAQHKRRAIEDILHDFEEILKNSQLSTADRIKFTNRGIKTLTTFLEQRYDSFSENQQVERSFAGEHVLIDEAHCSGAIDLIDIDQDEKTIFVTDYKTGKAAPTWQGRNEYEKIKLHHYKQQLMMYKLLVENSRQFSGYTVTGGRIEFLEPDPRGNIVLLNYSYNQADLDEFKQLINVVWRNIHSLEFPNVTETEKLDNILEFEQKLLTSL